MDITALKKACKGVVATPDDANFAELLHGNLWNRLIPERAPQVFVRVNDEQDVIAAIQFARDNKLKVVVRGGGHNWCQPTLRNGGVLIDLKNLNRVISIDAAARKAVVQPIISNRDTQKALNAQGMTFPSGHCPQVKLSGYLLGGGMCWNPGVWGHGAGSVEAVELVTAEGKLITASQDENQDYFWAARGAGTGFFGVATRYHLKLYPLPKAMHGCSHFYPLEQAAKVGTWLSEISGELAASVELSLFLITAPPELQERTAAQGGKVCLVTATSFAETAEQARAELKPLDDCPFLNAKLSSIRPAPVTFEQLFDASGAVWPEGLRARAESVFYQANAGELVTAISEHFTKAPSPITVLLFAILTGPNLPPKPGDGAYSMNAPILGGPWTQWKTAGEDEANSAWHDECVARLKPFVKGYYIGESDSVSAPSSATRAFSSDNWKRLADLRDKYDPDGVFFGYFDGLRNTMTG
ncbi:MAG: FAD-binding oxidoreductase [Opitutales bacterium]|jgi:FAD/FMN-containing dehydrogenase